MRHPRRPRKRTDHPNAARRVVRAKQLRAFERLNVGALHEWKWLS